MLYYKKFNSDSRPSQTECMHVACAILCKLNRCLPKSLYTYPDHFPRNIVLKSLIITFRNTSADFNSGVWSLYFTVS